MKHNNTTTNKIPMNYYIEYREDWKTCTIDDITMAPDIVEADLAIIAVSNTDKIGFRMLKNRYGELGSDDTMPAKLLVDMIESSTTRPVTRKAIAFVGAYILSDLDAFRKHVDPNNEYPQYVNTIIEELCSKAI